ncbi:MAG: hypothetical protein HGA37_11815 [Lentimicrobium sp.]|nr:hypothetical protein [Lentimicrobium sp.]
MLNKEEEAWDVQVEYFRASLFGSILKRKLLPDRKVSTQFIEVFMLLNNNIIYESKSVLIAIVCAGLTLVAERWLVSTLSNQAEA